MEIFSSSYGGIKRELENYGADIQYRFYCNKPIAKRGGKAVSVNKYDPTTETLIRISGNVKSAYMLAVDGGYQGTEQQFIEELANFKTYADIAEDSAESAATDAEDAREASESAVSAYESVRDIMGVSAFSVDFNTGELIYTNDAVYTFTINQSTGNLEWEVVTT